MFSSSDTRNLPSNLSLKQNSRSPFWYSTVVIARLLGIPPIMYAPSLFCQAIGKDKREKYVREQGKTFEKVFQFSISMPERRKRFLCRACLADCAGARKAFYAGSELRLRMRAGTGFSFPER